MPLLHDVRIGARMLAKDPLVTGAALFSLGLALGAAMATSALVEALILRPLPVRQPQHLIYLALPTYTSERPEADTFNDPLFRDLRDAARGRADLFAMSTQVMRQVIFDAGGEREQVRTQFVSGDAFDRLGVTPAAGRLIAPSDDVTPGAHPVSVVSHAFWMRRFGGDRQVVGRWFTFDGRPYQIVGVTNEQFPGIEPGRPTDVWVPYAMYNPHAFGNASFGWFRIVGRLNDGVRPEQAQAALQPVFAAFRRAHARAFLAPGSAPAVVDRYLNTPLYVRDAGTGPSPLRRQFGRPLWILSGVALLVLLIAGSNVANLFLARMAARDREMALRLSIGASRGRLIQQVLVESALLAAGACALGLVFARVAAPAIVAMLGSSGDPVRLDLAMNWRVATSAAALTLLVTAVFGLAPALRASGAAPMTVLKSAGRGSPLRSGLMRHFVGAQVAFGLIVLFVGSLLVLSFERLAHVNPGFAADEVMLVSVETVSGAEPVAARAALLQALDALRRVHGVQAVSASEFLLLGRAWTHYLHVPGTLYDNIEATMVPVTSGFFETMKIPIVSGRGLAPREVDMPGAPAIVVSENFARRYFGGAPAVGRTIDARFGARDSGHAYEVVGVAADAKYDLREAAAPTIYLPLTERLNGTIHVRVSGNPAALAAPLRDAMRAATPLFRVTSVAPLSDAVGRTLLRERLLALLSGFFALVGLALAAVGLYGVLTYSVVQRTREIGIRSALGAPQRRLVWMVLADTIRAALGGAVIGVAGGVALSRSVQSLLFEVTPLAFSSLALPLAAFAAVGLIAAVRPAWRIGRMDPAVALREE